MAQKHIHSSCSHRLGSHRSVPPKMRNQPRICDMISVFVNKGKDKQYIGICGENNVTVRR